MRHIPDDIRRALHRIEERLAYRAKKMQMSTNTLQKVGESYAVVLPSWLPYQLFGIPISISPDMRDGTIAFMDGGLVLDFIDIGAPEPEPEIDDRWVRLAEL